jgi:predicted ATPase
MIRSLAIRNFRSIRQLDELRLERFHVLVGPNGSGKTTFLDAIEFVRDSLATTPREAVERRAPSFEDLTYNRQGGYIELSFEIEAGERILSYDLLLKADAELGVKVHRENLGGKEGSLLSRNFSAVSYRREDFEPGKMEMQLDSFHFSSDKLALALVPPDERRYPLANEVRRILLDGVTLLQLDGRRMSQPCPPTRPFRLEGDGSNLARVVGGVLRAGPPAAEQILIPWQDHLGYAIPDLNSVHWKKREADNAEYLALRFADGLECPAWL